MVQGYLGRAIDADINDTGPGARRGIPRQTVMGPGTGTEGTRTAGIAHQGNAPRQTNLAGMRMTTQHDIKISVGGMPVNLGRMCQQD